METATPIRSISIINFIFYKINVVGFILICFINITFSGCQSSSKKTEDLDAIKFELNADSTKIILKGLGNHIVDGLKSDSLNTVAWQNLFSVYDGTSTDGEEFSEPLPGLYAINPDNYIIFSPVSSFNKGHVYYVRFYYPQYYSVNNALQIKSLPGKVMVKEDYFKF